jgi:hypothetical protein
MPTNRFCYCHSPAHGVTRRRFLGMLGSSLLMGPTLLSDTIFMESAQAAEVKKQGKAVIILYLGGGASQLETWDPKPGTLTGGPFRAIPTSVPGVHISELLPKLARQMHHLALVRSVDNSGMGADHEGSGMHLGRKKDPFVNYPSFAEIATQELGRWDTRIPDHVELQMTDVFRYESTVKASFLGTRVQPVILTGGKRPPNLDRLPTLPEVDHADREALRDFLSRRFEAERRSATAEGYNRTFQRVRGLMSCDALLDVDRSDPKDLDRYGPTTLARHCLLARRLVEAGVSVVKIRHTWWDTHADNFEGHEALTAQLDQALATLLEDLHQRGLLETTLVLTTSEFGRTPRISAELGRDHWANAWSVTLAGCGVAMGAVVGKTNADGTAIVERRVTPADLHHTYYQLLGIDPSKRYYQGSRPVYLADEHGKAVHELLPAAVAKT